MSLETATKISELVATNPQGTDPKSQGDDHLRMLKTVLQNNAIKSEIGQSVTPANNFTFDASADNGTMKLARESGQDIMTVDAAGKVAFPQNAQTWQNVTASRALGTVYQNNTGQTIQVNAIAGSTTSGEIVATCQGVSIYGSTAGAGEFSAVTFNVPTGTGYAVSRPGTANLASWTELR